MALKDLIADRGKLNEEAIERIVADFVRYDPSLQELIFTPEGGRLGNESKVLVFLVAVNGWRFVVDDPQPASTKPADLEAKLGIAGGSLRPILKKLKDGHLLAVNQGHYSIQLANLDAVERILSGEKSAATPRRTASARKAVKSKTDPVIEGTEATEATDTKKPKAGVPIRASLAKLLATGWFDQDRTLSQVVNRLHEKAIIAKATSLSGPIAELVRDEKLARKKVIENGKEIWSYRAL